ncbi:MAG: MFS transporter [Erythrobacter sp.]
MSSDTSQPSAKPLSRFEQIALAAIVGLSVANAYYIHPIVSEVALTFGVGAGEIGIVPALNQVALAVGILFLLPLGDRYGNRRLTTIFATFQAVCLLMMALAQSFALFTLASTVLGVVTIAPYLLPTYASKRTPPDQLGRITAIITTGMLFGILFARVGAGVIAEYLGWQQVYFLAGGVMAVLAVSLRFLMRGREQQTGVDSGDHAPGEGAQSYFALLGSLWPLMRQYPHAILSGCIQALNFGMFIALWLGLALHLTSPEMGYSVDVVGFLALTAALSMITTPRLGVVADRLGAERARLFLSLVQVGAVALLIPFGNNLFLLLIPIILNGMAGPVLDVSGRMTILRVAPAIRTRLMTIYVVIMFSGGGIASLMATTAYEAAGWYGIAGIAGAFALGCALLSALALKTSAAKANLN